ncbi:hypothetical protein DFJ73DRAFT_817558 [Zopfochytrium polystomum]|nr:hypothetical protein DFJ73DRAFT_817558 [Zopfochytrium polystomum]
MLQHSLLRRKTLTPPNQCSRLVTPMDTQPATTTTTTEDDDDWEIEEESYVVLDLGPDMTNEALFAAVDKHNGLSLTGLDGPRPFLRIGNMYYEGTYDQVIGTDLIFAASAKPRKRPDNLSRTGAKQPQPPETQTMTPMGSSSVRVKFSPIRAAESATVGFANAERRAAAKRAAEERVAEAIIPIDERPEGRTAVVVPLGTELPPVIYVGNGGDERSNNAEGGKRMNVDS